MSTPYDAALELAKKELASKKANLHRLQSEVTRLQHTVMALTALVGKPEEIEPAAGITECVKTALRIQTPTGLYPTTIKLKLEEAGFPFQDMKNPMATIHSVLKRLAKAGFIRRSETDGKQAYFWKTDKPKKKTLAATDDDGNDIPF